MLYHLYTVFSLLTCSAGYNVGCTNVVPFGILIKFVFVNWLASAD